MDTQDDNALVSQKGRKMLTNGGYMFTFHKLNTTREVKFWRCRERNNGCKGRLHTDMNDVIIKQMGNHTHGTDAVGLEVMKAKTAMKRRAHKTMEQPSQIINSVIQNIDQATMGQMPNQDASRKIIQHVRNQNAIAPPTSINISSLVIPDRYKNYETSEGEFELFLLGDTGSDDHNRILLFGRDSY